MADIQIRITNISEIRSAFSKAPALMMVALSQAVKQTVFSIGRQSRVNTPVDTGRLRGSTYERFSGLSGEVGTHTNYDMFVHEGTRFMKGRPYLRLAVESKQAEVDMFFTNAVQGVLNQIANQT